MSDIATGKDSDFSEERLIQRYNSDLANSLGNLLNRSLSMAAKFRLGKVSYNYGEAKDLINHALSGEHLEVQREPDPLLHDLFRIALYLDHWQDAYTLHFSEGSVNTALSQVNECAMRMNQLVDSAAPWKQAKDPTQADRLDAVLYTLAESLRIIAILISPVLPRAAAGIFAQLNWDKPFRLEDAKWGGLPDGHVLGTPTPLFPRIETAPPA